MTELKNLLDIWIQLLNKGDIESLLKLYDREAILIPTFSDKILDTPEKFREYFKNLGTREGLCVSLHEKSLITQDLQNHIFSLNGIYSWSFNIDGGVKNFEARFSYLVDLSKDSPILQHHSSQIPDKF